MGKASEISALWSKIKPQIGELVRLCHEVESHAEDTSEAFRRGYETAKHECEDCPKQAYTDAIRMEGYQKGLSDAWDAARKICLNECDGGMTPTEVNKIFGVGFYRDALLEYSASEAIEKIRQYEQEKEEIQLWNEVINGRNFKGTVTGIEDNGMLTIFCQDGTWIRSHARYWKKTGRHFPEIAEVLKKMKGGEQDG